MAAEVLALSFACNRFESGPTCAPFAYGLTWARTEQLATATRYCPANRYWKPRSIKKVGQKIELRQNGWANQTICRKALPRHNGAILRAELGVLTHKCMDALLSHYLARKPQLLNPLAGKGGQTADVQPAGS